MSADPAAVELQHPTRGAGLTVQPRCGGTVTSLRLAAYDRPCEILRSESDSVGFRCHDPLFRGRFLWPFCDRIPEGRYAFEGKQHLLPKNDRDAGDAIHGFLYRMPVTVVRREESESTAVLEMRASIDADTADGYPFAGTVDISLTLERSRLILRMHSRNTGDAPCPVSFGWHPYFQLPDVSSVDELGLKTSADSFVPVDASLKPTGAIQPSSGTEFDLPDISASEPNYLSGRQLDIAFVNRKTGSIHTVVESSTHRLHLRQDGAFRFQQMFIPPSRDSIAVEPITAAANAFNEPQLGLHVLLPGDAVEGQFTIELKSR